MITDDEVMRLFEQADPARRTDDHNDTPDATGYLAALRMRSNNVTYIQPTDNSTERSGRRFTMMAVAAAVVAVIVVGALVFAARGDDDGIEIPATVPPTTPAPSTTASPPVENALGRATDFLASFAAGDPGAVTSLQADGFAMYYSWPGEELGDLLTEYDWLGESYQVGSATNYVEPSCTLVDESAGVAVVECETAMELAVHQATNTEGLGTTVTLRVGIEGVVGMESAYSENLGSKVLRPFDEWQEANRPGVLGDDNNDPATAAESFEYAQTEAQLAVDWATFAVDATEAAVADHNAGNLDGFLDRFDEGTVVLGVIRADVRDVFGALMAGGNTYVTSSCEPNGIEFNVLAVACELVVQPPSFDVSGVGSTGTIRMVVRADGTIVSNTNTVDSGPFDDFNTAFQQWLATAHPDVHAQVTWVDVEESRIAGAEDQPLIAQYYEEFVAQSGVYPLGG